MKSRWLKKAMAAFLAVLMTVCAVPVAAFVPEMVETGEEFEPSVSAISGVSNGGKSVDYGDLTYTINANGEVECVNYFNNSKRLTNIKNAELLCVIDDFLLVLRTQNSITEIMTYSISEEKEIDVYQIENKIEAISTRGKCIYYLSDHSIFEYDILTQTKNCIYRNPEMTSFVLSDFYTIAVYIDSDLSKLSSQEYILISIENNEDVSKTKLQAEDSSYSVSIGGNIIPFSDYPNGSYFTDNGQPCAVGAHKEENKNCYMSESYCNCKCTYNGVWLKSSQCMGFASMTFLRLYGHTIYDQCYKSVSTIAIGSVTKNRVQSLISDGSIKPGAHIRTINGHSLIYMGSDSQYFYTYEGNTDNRCRVSVIRNTWDSAIGYYNKNGISYVQLPNNYPDTGTLPDPTATTTSSSTGHKYAVYNYATTWENAKAKCEELGGYLATITNDSEQSLVLSLVQNLNKPCWIGAYRDSGSSTYKWITGESFSYINWDDDEPSMSNGGRDERFVGIYANDTDTQYSTTGKWNDFSETTGTIKGFVCEWNPQTYTVSYNANGGTGAPGNQTKIHGVSLTLSSVKPTKDGYTFQGWSTSSTGGVEYNSGSAYTGNANLTLYAVWKSAHTHNYQALPEIQHPHRVWYYCSCGSSYYPIENGQYVTQKLSTCSICYPVTGVSLNKTAITLEMGKSFTLTATVVPSNAANKEVTWSSSNTLVAKVYSDGEVEAYSEGMTVITVTTNDGAYTATCTVTVESAEKPAGNLTWELQGDTLYIRGKGNMDDYSYQTPAPWANTTTYTKVIIEEGVTYIGSNAFSERSSLTTVTIPSSVTNIGICAFWESGITEVTISKNVINIGDSAFSRCKNLTAFIVEKTNPNYSSDERGALFNKNETRLIQYPAGNKATSYCIPSTVTSIGKSAFSKSRHLTQVTISPNVTSIERASFNECSNLISITIPSGVESINEGVFYFCQSLTSITIPSSVTSISGDAVMGCTNLSDIYYAGSLSDWQKINIVSQNVYLDNATIHFAKSGECGENLTWEIQGDILYIRGEGKMKDYTTESQAPWKEASFTEVVIEDGVTSIGNYAFYGNNQNSVIIPDSVTSIGKSAFYSCGLTSVTIPDSVTSISDKTFEACFALKSVTIPNSVTAIGNGAFSECKELTDVFFQGSQTEWNNLDISDYNSYLTNATLHTIEPVTSIILDQTTATLKKGETLTLTATITPSDAANKAFTVTSSNPSVMSAKYRIGVCVGDLFGDSTCTASHCEFTALSAGSTTLTFTTEDGLKTASCTVTVTEPVVNAKAKFTLSETSGRPGDTVKITLSLKTEETVNSIAISGITYDKSIMTFTGFSDYEHIEDLTVLPPTFDEEKMAIVIGLKTAAAFDGDICTLNFKINENALEGVTNIDASSVVKLKSTEIPSAVASGKVNVRLQTLGDIDGNDTVDIDDAVLLFQYSMLPELYPISYAGNLDFNKDGTVDIDDAVRLFQYSMLPDLYPLE